MMCYLHWADRPLASPHINAYNHCRRAGWSRLQQQAQSAVTLPCHAATCDAPAADGGVLFDRWPSTESGASARQLELAFDRCRRLCSVSSKERTCHFVSMMSPPTSRPRRPRELSTFTNGSATAG